jgi:predicted DNA-binding WGR domain protein
MTRRFEFVGGTSAKFWEVSQASSSVTVRYGRLGTSGQQQTKALPTSDAAQRHVETLVERNLGKGYAERVAV